MSSSNVAIIVAGSTNRAGTVRNKMINDERKNARDPMTVRFFNPNMRVFPNRIPIRAEKESEIDTIRMAGR